MPAIEKSYKPLFFPPSVYWQSVRRSAVGQGESLPRPSAIVECHSTTDGCKGFAICSVSLNGWNKEVPGPSFRSRRTSPGDVIRSLTEGVTCVDPAKRPLQATGYIFDCELTFVGMLDLRYFGEHLPRAVEFNVEELALPVSTTLQVRFQLNGGGSPQIVSPPLISSVFVEIK